MTCNSLYILINNALSLCMIMSIISLLVGRSKSFATLHLYWVWALLVHPTPKNQSFAKCVHHTYLHVVFHRHSKVNYLSATFKTFKMYSCFVFLFSSWGRITCFTVSFMVTWLHTLTSMHNVLVQKSQTEQGNECPAQTFWKEKLQTHKQPKTALCTILMYWRTIWEPLLKSVTVKGW